MLDLDKKFIEKFGIDIDTHDQKLINGYIERMRRVGSIIAYYKTKHGFHFKVKVPKPISFKRSMELRYFCGDDSRRMIKDVIKIWAGAEEFDLLFDKKWKGWKIKKGTLKRYREKITNNHANHKRPMKTCRICMELKYN